MTLKLFTELNETVDYEILEEAAGGPKTFAIKGIFLQGDIKNKNGRRYPVDVLEREVGRYVKEYVEKKRAFGELGHPSGPTINMERISHVITELKRDGSNFVGKAKILDTPYGNIVKSLMHEGCTLGVSSRGLGTLKEVNGIQEVQDDFYLATAGDIVADPSAPDAFVHGIMEGKAWVFENGLFKEAKLEAVAKTINKAAARRQSEAAILEAWEDLFGNIANQFLEGRRALPPGWSNKGWRKPVGSDKPKDGTDKEPKYSDNQLPYWRGPGFEKRMKVRIADGERAPKRKAQGGDNLHGFSSEREYRQFLNNPYKR